MSFQRAARLVLTLVDNVSKPAQAIQSAMTGVNAAIATAGSMTMAPARAVAAGGRAIRRNASDMTVASGALTFGLAAAAKSVYRMEDILNEIEGRRFGKNDIFNLADGTEMTRKSFRQSVTKLISEINKTAPRNAVEISKAYNQLVQAGLNHEQTEGILPISIDFAIAGNYDTEEAADKLTNVMTAMRMPMATFDEARTSALRAADVISYAANQTNSTVEQMTEAFKYAAPSASALGIDIEQLAAMFLIQARRGIKASEAGVSVRAMFTRMVRPTNMAQASLARYNIDLADYLEKSQEISAADISSTFAYKGLETKGAEAAMQKVLDSSQNTAEKVKQITQIIMKEVGDSSTISAQQISDSISEILFGFGESLDVEGLVADMQKAGIAMSDFFTIFDVRQGARTLALFGDDLSGWVENLREHAEGFAEALRKTRMQGVVGAFQRSAAAMVDLTLAAAASGVLDAATNALEKFAAAMVKLAEVDPHLLEMGTYALLGVAAIAPLGFALTGLAAAASLALNPIAWAAAGLGYLAYLNMDGIISYVRSFGAAVQENMGPRTANLIGKAKELLNSLITTHDFDGAAAGTEHGSWFSQFIENEIAGIEHMIDQWSQFGQRLSNGWASFSSWWDNLVTSTHTKAAEWAQAFRDGIRWLSDGSADAWLHEAAAGLWSGTKELFGAGWEAFVTSQFATTFAKAGSVLYEAGANMIQSLWDGAVAKFGSFIEWVRGIPGRVRAAIGRINLSDLMSFGSRGGGGEAAPAESAPPKRALGGPIKAGLTYQINEHEQEFITPNFNGRVHRPRDMGGGTSVVFNNKFVLGGGSAKGQVEELVRELDRQLNRAAQVAFGSGNAYGDA